MVELLGRYSKLAKLPDFTHARSRPKREKPPGHIHSARRRLGPDLIAQLVADYEAGQPTTALMSAYGIGKGTVLRLLYASGVSPRAQGQKNIELDEAVIRYRDGWSLARLAVSYGCDPETVRTALKTAGVTLRRRQGWPPTESSSDNDGLNESH